MTLCCLVALEGGGASTEQIPLECFFVVQDKLRQFWFRHFVYDAYMLAGRVCSLDAAERRFETAVAIDKSGLFGRSVAAFVIIIIPRDFPLHGWLCRCSRIYCECFMATPLPSAAGENGRSLLGFLA